jgi:acetylornithine deacetylase/succinyl-diaminopimelate desuccinylase-like protein
LARHLAEIGLHHIQILPGINKGAPSVYADWLLAPGKPTLLLYGHYDVQPVDPIKEWRSPPFKASIIGDNLYARGASDDKGQLFIHLKAIESYLRTNRRLPINIKMRLVPNQEPAEIAFFLQQHIARMTHPAVRSRLKISGSSRPVLLPRNSPVMLAAIRAIEQTWGIPPVFTRSGGSIPLVEQLRRSNESTDRFTWFWST